jgi:hypothetical protein
MEVATNEPAWAQQVRVFPNPASDRLFVSPGQVNWQSLELFDGQGHYLGNWDGENLQDGLPVQYLPSGIYFIRRYANEGTIIRRWVKG